MSNSGLQILKNTQTLAKPTQGWVYTDNEWAHFDGYFILDDQSITIMKKQKKIRLDKLDIGRFFIHNNEILQLLDIDMLDQWADVQNVKTLQSRTIEIYIYVEPVDMEIVALPAGSVSPDAQMN